MLQPFPHVTYSEEDLHKTLQQLLLTPSGNLVLLAPKPAPSSSSTSLSTSAGAMQSCSDAKPVMACSDGVVEFDGPLALADRQGSTGSGAEQVQGAQAMDDTEPAPMQPPTPQGHVLGGHVLGGNPHAVVGGQVAGGQTA